MADDGSTAFPELVFVLSSSPRLNIEASMSLVSIFGLKNSNNLIFSQNQTAERLQLSQVQQQEVQVVLILEMQRQTHL